jgi:TP901 family phage tail tape measure protein
MLGAEQNYNLKVNLTGNATQLNIALQSSTSKLQQFSARAKSIGSSLSRSLTLPLALVGGASIKMALDFDKSMTKIKTLVGVASDEVDAMGGAVKRLAVDTGVNANDAADALFFITSAGLRGADAMKVLEAATKASAIGLGEVKTVADAVTSAVNAYGQENLSAESATDILTAAVREGKLEADSLAQSMGKVLPVSSQLGVGFEEVGAALAAMSRTGTDAAMATTSLRGILSALLNPSSQANEELENFGLSAQGLREQLKEQGLLSVLKTLTDRFGDNQEAAGKVFGNVRALTGVLDLMGNNVSTTEQIFASMTNTTGTLNTAFTELEDELSFKFKKSLEAVKTSFTELGKTLSVAILPTIQKLAGLLTTAINKFNNLNESTKNLILTLGGIALAIGPAIVVLGTLGTVISALISPVALVIAAIVGIGLAVEDIVVNFDVVKLKIEKWGEKVKIIFRAVKETFKNIFSLGGGTGTQIAKDMQEALDAVTEEYDKMIAEIDTKDSIAEKIIKGIQNAYEDIKNASAGIGQAITDGLNQSLTTNVESLGQRIAIGFEKVGSVAMAATSSWDALNKKIDESNEKISDFDESFDNSVKNTQNSAMAMQAIMNAFAMQISKAFENGSASVGQFAAQVVSIIGDLLIQLGTFAIIGSNLMGEALIPIVGAAAGAAAIAVGAAMKGLASKFMSEGVQTFANGGIISGPTLGLMGEYAGARHNPEVVAPLNKLKSMIGSNGSQNLSGEFVVRGQDLVLALQRAERNRNRFK